MCIRDSPYGDGKTYLAPMFYSPCGLFYNAGFLKEKGWDVPKTLSLIHILTEVNSEGYYLTGWYDNFGCAAGKRVRVIVAVKKD